MSKTIEQQVVEMQFDNRHFEQNVKTSMSTLDKLKQSLNLTGASKGLEDINEAAKNNNMSTLGGGVEAVRVKFSALQVMGVTALANITNSAINAGKRIAKSLTIDPITTGFSEYELKMGAIQTIMASTGEGLETVNKYLNELNEYSDKTIYSFSDMTQNIGKFTNAGVKLEDAVLAIKGISNEAAVSGATANEASRAMYNFAQALSAGYVKLIDWKSIENANMATVEFKEQLLQTALECKTVAKTADGMYKVLTKNNKGSRMDQTINATKNFNDSLNYQWMTTDVLVKTLSKYADEQTAIGSKATKAATEVKTFTQMMDSLKESAQSGWATTWELIFGNFYEAKDLWTDVNNSVGSVLDKISDARNSFLKTALGSSWEDFTLSIEEAGLSAGKFSKELEKTLKKSGVSVKDLTDEYGDLSNAVKAGKVSAEDIRKTLQRVITNEEKAAKSTGKLTLSVKELKKISNQVIDGSFGNGEARVKALTKAGYDYATIQNKVNEILGSSVRHISQLTESQKNQLVGVTKLSDAQLKNAGYTDKQIAALKDLKKAAKDTGGSVNDLINDLEKPSGRMLIIESFKNIGDTIMNVVNAVREAWNNVFGNQEEIKPGEKVYGLISDFRDLTVKLKESSTELENFKTIVQSMFDMSKLGTKIISASLLSGLTLINAFCQALGTNLLEVATKVGEKIIEFSKWFNDKNLFSKKHITHLGNILAEVYTQLKLCIDEFLKLEKVQAIINRFKETFQKLFGADTFSGIVDAISPAGIIKKIQDIFEKVQNWIAKGNEVENLGKYLIDGLVKGMTSALKSLVSTVVEIVDLIIDTFCSKSDGMDINSPSRVMMTLGGFVIAGLISGMIAKGGEVGAFMKDFGTTLLKGFKTMLTSVGDLVSKIDFGKIVAIGLSAGMIYVIKKMADALELFGSPLEALSGILNATKKAISGVSDAVAGAIKLRSKAVAMKNIAIGIGILAAAIWLLAPIPWQSLWKVVAVLGALGAIMIGLAIACEKLDSISSFGLKSASIAAIAISLLAIAAAFKLLSTIKADQLGTAIGSFIIICVGLVAVFGSLAKVTKGAENLNFKGLGKVFTKLAIAMLLMVAVIKLASLLKAADIIKGAAVMALMSVFYKSIINVCKDLDFRAVNQVGKLASRLSVALLLMIGVIKLASMLSWGEIAKGAVVIAGITAFLAATVALTELMKTGADTIVKINTISKMLLAISASMILMGIALKLVGGLSLKAIIKGTAALAGMTAMMYALVSISRFSGVNAAKAGAMLIEFGITMLILSAVMIILKELDPDGIGKAMTILGGITLMLGALIAVTKFAEHADKVKGTLITLTVAIGVMAVAIVALSLLDPKKVAVAAAALGGVMAMFALLIYTLKFINIEGKNWLKSLATVAVLTGVIVAVAFLIRYLADNVNADEAIKSAGSIGILLITLSASLRILSKTGELSPSSLATAFATLVIMSLLIVMIGEMINAVKLTNPENAIVTATAIGMLLLVLSTSFKILTSSKPISKANAPRLIATLGVLILAIALIGTVIQELDGCNPIHSITSAIAIGILLAALAVSFRVITDSKKSISKAALPGVLSTLGLLIGAIAAIALVIYGLNKCNPVNAIATSMALSILLLSLALAFDIISYSGPMASVAAGTLGSMLIVVAGLAVILGVLSALNVQPSIEAAKALSVLLIGMSASLVLLSLAGTMGPAASFGVTALMQLMVSIGALLLVVSGLVAIFPKLEEFLSKGIPIFEKIGEAIGAFFGGIGKGFAEATAAALPAIGAYLSDFMEEASGFVDGLQKIGADDTIVKGAKNLASAIVALTVAEMINAYVSITSFGTTSLVNLGRDLSSFLFAAKPFFRGLEDIDADSVNKAHTVAEILKSITSAQLMDSLNKWIIGSTDISEFGTKLKEFGEAIITFDTTISGHKFDNASIEAAKAAAEIMIALQKALVPMGGVVGFFCGERDLGKFGSQLEDFGTGIKAFSDSVSNGKGGSALNSKAIEAAKKSGELMVALQEGVAPVDGLLQLLSGTTGLDTFGEDIKLFGEGIAAASKALTGADGKPLVNTDSIQAAADAGNLLAAVQKAIPSDKIFDGKISIDEFGSQIDSFGWYIKSYSDRLAGVDGEKVAASAKWSQSLVTVAKCAQNIDKDKVQNFEKIEDIGSSMKGYYTSITGIDESTISKSITNAKGIVRLVNSLVEMDDSGIGKFQTAVDKLSNVDLNGFAEGFNKSLPRLSDMGSGMVSALVKGMTSKYNAVSNSVVNIVSAMAKGFVSKTNSFLKVGAQYTTQLAKGMLTKASIVSAAVLSIGSSGASSAKLSYTDFYSAGKYVADGFASGIKIKSYVAVNAATAMAKAAAQAAKDALKINSPSKIFMGLGSGVVEGFVKGIYDNTSSVVNSTNDMANSATSGFSRAIGKVTDYLNGNMDAQPTIRPVLDLSDVESGAATIGSMFGNPSMGVISNLGAVNTMMNRRNQNGPNDDVVSAINKLGSLLGGNTGNTYQIGGITYNDDTPIANAVGDLIRAITLEGRV